tara:strand:- start:211 stop:657 length:447 start_codon:yes stop_codon:yes gene_type:complete
MAIFVGSTQINDIKIGSTAINEVYVGSNLVWSRGLTVTEGYLAISVFGQTLYYYGYSAPLSFGSISGNINGAAVNASYFLGALFILTLSGNRAQNFFTSITPQGGSALASSAATRSYDSSSGRTTWTWTSTSRPGNWDGSGTSTLVVT